MIWTGKGRISIKYIWEKIYEGYKNKNGRWYEQEKEESV